MSTYIWADQQRTGHPLSRFVLMVLADGAGDDGGVRWTPAQLMDETEATEAQINWALDKLQRLNLLEYAPDIELGPNDWGPGWRLCVPRPDVRPVPRSELKQRRIEFNRSVARARLRAEISEGLHNCTFCSSRKELQVDHIRPLDMGGTNDLANLRVLCGDCNRRRRTRVSEVVG